ncbi:methicillin resistance protein [Vibrio navarrensis]|nr:methicillin resistance protein [Vibrio navarrensis]
MSEFLVKPFQGNDFEWDEFVARSHKSTFMHTRNFLNYHKNRYDDHSVMVYKDDNLVAIFPAAKYGEFTIVSHIGATYGGLVYDERIYGNVTVSILLEIRKYYFGLGFTEIIYKVTPSLYHSVGDDDDIYALFRLGASLERVDINAYIDISNRLRVSNQRKRNFKKALKNGISLHVGFDNILEFYEILSTNLESKYDSRPVHSVSELKDLNQRFPGNLELQVIKNTRGQVISGVLFFNINNVKHAQYIASSSIGYELGGLDYLFETVIASFGESNQRFLAFGTSNEDNGRVLNQTLYRFKRQFGSASVSHLFFKIT